MVINLMHEYFHYSHVQHVEQQCFNQKCNTINIKCRVCTILQLISMVCNLSRHSTKANKDFVDNIAIESENMLTTNTLVFLKTYVTQKQSNYCQTCLERVTTTETNRCLQYVALDVLPPTQVCIVTVTLVQNQDHSVGKKNNQLFYYVHQSIILMYVIK